MSNEMRHLCLKRTIQEEVWENVKSRIIYIPRTFIELSSVYQVQPKYQ